MRTADIKVGGHYAYFNHKYASAEHVEVLETKVSQTQGYGFSRRTVKSGVKVKFVGGRRDGVEFIASARQIERTWEEQEDINAKAAEARRQAEESKRATAARRANLARRIEDRLEAHGVPVSVYLPTLNHRAEAKAALLAVGFPTGQNTYGDEVIVTRITGLDDFMDRGILREKDAEYLLADSEVLA